MFNNNNASHNLRKEKQTTIIKLINDNQFEKKQRKN